MSTRVDVAVIGRGLIGAAAARHLAEGGVATALIGPDDPADRQSSRGPFSSHGDEGRITRIAGRTALWSELAARSIARYADIAQRSGIRFHHPRGLVAAFDGAAEWAEHGQRFGSEARVVNADWVCATTGIHPPDTALAWEPAPAGHINPRRLVAAQTLLTEAAGGHVLRAAVTRIDRYGGGWRVAGAWGELEARQLLLATGAFGSELTGVSLDLERRPRTVLLAEMPDDGRVAAYITDAPFDERLDESYWVPPVPYPDGRTYLKIGGNLRTHPLLDPHQLVEWFHTDGDPDEADALENTLRALLPDARIRSTRQLPCVITGTATGYPYLGVVDDGLAVALGGNGSAAKSSDELGRLAATCLLPTGWDQTIDPAPFTPRLT